jgi:hypothetical protein
MNIMHDSTARAASRLNRSNLFFIIALGLVNTLAFTLVLCSVGFFCGLTISGWQFAAACFFSLLVNYWVIRSFMKVVEKRVFWQSSTLILAIMAAMILVAGWFYDISFDGQWYHQETIIRLHEHWNPFYQELPPPAGENSGAEPVWCSGVDKPDAFTGNSAKTTVNLKYLNINHFSKGMEIIEASIYQLSNRIETSKAINGIFLLASFLLTLSCLYRFASLSSWKLWLLAVLFSFNPIAVSQLFSFCVDGIMASSLLCLAVAGCLLFRETTRYYLLLLGSLIVLTINIKFTGVVFAGIFCVGLLVLLLYKKRSSFKPIFFACTIAAFIGIGCCGFHPYITNSIHEHNPFYGLSETRNEIASITPALFKDRNRFEKLFLSLSSATDAHGAEKSSIARIPKLPFKFSKKEIEYSNDPQLLLASFGPFFSGALLLAILVFIVAVFRIRKSTIFKVISFLLLIIALSVVIVPDAWWLRFVPQFWLLPVLMLLMAELFSFRFDRILKGLLYTALTLNICWAAMGIVYNLLFTSMIDYQLSQLRTFKEPVRIEYCSYKGFTSNRVRLSEKNIPFVEGKVTGQFVDNIFYSNTRFETPVALPELPQPLPMRLLKKIKGTSNSKK